MAQVKALIGNIKGKDGITNIYSTSETVIGTWNGSTLYRKMILANIPITSTKGTAATSSFSSGISYTKIKSVYLNEVRQDTFVWSTAGYNDHNDAIVVYAGGTNVYIENYHPFNNGASCYIVIEYIK